jgi:hypothetical protein
MMDATLVLIDSNAELARARALVDRLWDSNDPADVARLEAQARLIAAYEERKWPHRPPRTGSGRYAGGAASSPNRSFGVCVTKRSG